MANKNINVVSAEDIANNIKSFGKSLLYKDRATRNLSTEERNELWEVKKLPTFDEFCNDPEHMNFPPLSERQKAVSDFMIGDDPTKAFDNGNSRCVLAWGKGTFSDQTLLTDVMTKETHTLKEWSLLSKKINISAHNFNKEKKVITRIEPPFFEVRDKLIKVKTKSGKIAFINKDHKFFTKTGWKKVSELNVGDKIAKEKANV